MLTGNWVSEGPYRAPVKKQSAAERRKSRVKSKKQKKRQKQKQRKKQKQEAGEGQEQHKIAATGSGSRVSSSKSNREVKAQHSKQASQQSSAHSNAQTLPSSARSSSIHPHEGKNSTSFGKDKSGAGKKQKQQRKQSKLAAVPENDIMMMVQAAQAGDAEHMLRQKQKSTKLDLKESLTESSNTSISKRNDTSVDVLGPVGRPDVRSETSKQHDIESVKQDKFARKSSSISADERPEERRNAGGRDSRHVQPAQGDGLNASTGFGSRNKPTQIRYRDILEDANESLRHSGVRRSAAPVRSKPSSHIFEDNYDGKNDSDNMVKSNTWESLGLDERLARHLRTAPRTSKSAIAPPPTSLLPSPEKPLRQRNHGLGLNLPTRVQRMAIPLILAGRDVVVRSETGSGKTMTFLLPLSQALASISSPRRVERKDGTLAIVLSPTRELAAQVHTWARSVLRTTPWIVSGIVSGGEKPKSEKARLRKGITLLVCTPGRLLYHLQNTQSFRTDCLRWLVLDEADRLMDLGFEAQLKSIITELQQRHRTPLIQAEPTDSMKSTKLPWQTVLLSATQSKSVSTLVGVALDRPAYVDASQQGKRSEDAKNAKDSQVAGEDDTEELQFTIPKQLSQHVALVDSPHRLTHLIGFLRDQMMIQSRDATASSASPSGGKGTGCRVVVFLTTCATVDFHYELLTALSKVAVSSEGRTGVTAGLGDVSNLAGVMRGRIYRLHGEVPQNDRMKTFRQFCSGESGILLCTDVAARGLDMPDVDWIVQYDPPSEMTEYVHRIGRTARRGRAGSSLLMLRPCEASYVMMLKKRLGVRLVELPANSLVEGLCDRHHGRAGGSRRRDVAMRRARSLQMLMERVVAGDSSLKEQAGHAFHTSVRAYACHSKETKSIFNVRRLHLGHVAKSYALRDPPSKIMSESREAKKLKKQQKHIDKEAQRKAKQGINSEFSSGSTTVTNGKEEKGSTNGANPRESLTTQERTSTQGNKKRKSGKSGVDGSVKKLKLSENFAAEEEEAMSSVLRFGAGQNSRIDARRNFAPPASKHPTVFDADDEELQELLSSASTGNKVPVPAKFKPRYASTNVDQPIWARGMGKGSKHSSSVSEFF